MSAQLNNISLKQSIYDDIIQHCMNEKPVEACGYLAGENNIITMLCPMHNILKSTTKFAFDPEEQFEKFEMVQKKDLKLLGYYHSHPLSEAWPSRRDIELDCNPNDLMAIVSLLRLSPSMKIFRISNEQIEEIQYVVVK